MRRTFFHISAAVVLLLICGGSVLAFSYSRGFNTLDSAIEECKGEGYVAQQCLNDLVVRIGKEEGLDAGFDALQSVYLADSEFAASCHGATHELGSQAYDAFEKGEMPHLSDKMSYCGFGFFHGFIEIFLQTGRPLSEARKFCDDAKNEIGSTIAGVSAGCYHGIGHGVVDGTDPATWGDELVFIEGGLNLCSRLGADEEAIERCASGVFNGLANVYDNPKYDLKLDADDPYRVCRSQTKEWAIDACYDQMNGIVNRLYPTFLDALSIAERRSEESHRATAIRAVASHRAQEALSDTRGLEEFIRDCGALDAEWRITCVQAFAVGLIEFGKPKQEYIAATDACIAAEFRVSECLEGIAGAVKERLEPRLHQVTCDYIAQKAGSREGERCTVAITI